MEKSSGPGKALKKHGAWSIAETGAVLTLDTCVLRLTTNY
jgi:hypothetical protein